MSLRGLCNLRIGNKCLLGLASFKGEGAIVQLPYRMLGVDWGTATTAPSLLNCAACSDPPASTL